MRIGITGMHEMPEILTGNLRELGYDATYFSGIRTLIEKRSEMDILIVIFPLRKLKMIILAKLLGMKVIVHWIGTDCLMVQKNPNKLMMKLLSPFIDTHLADAPHLAEELREARISARFVPIVPELMRAEPLPMPDEFKVLSYIMPDRPEFYGASMIGEIARRMPDVEFIITEEGRVPDAPPNINHLGLISFEEMEKLYRGVSVFLRLTVHDGISKAVLESLGFGRYVVRTIDFPACFKAKSVDGVVEILTSLKDVKEPNMEGVRFIADELNRDKLDEIWREVFVGL